MPNRPLASPLWARLWIAWAVAGLGTALALIIAGEAGVTLPARVWWWWALPGIGGGLALETVALLSPNRGDTLSEHVWRLEGGWRSIIVTFCLWAAWWLATGSAWPSAGIFFLVWTAWHFAFEGPTEPDPAVDVT